MLGKGGYGTVYDSVPYAVKEIDTSTMSSHVKEYTESEMQILSMCNHQNIVRLYDSFKEGKFLYFVMEKC